MNRIEWISFARAGAWLAVAMLCLGLAGGAEAAAVDMEEHGIECGSGKLVVDLPPELEPTCLAGKATGRPAGGNARLWTGSHERIEATGPGLDLWITAQVVGPRTTMRTTPIESLIAWPRDGLEPAENWGEAYQIAGYRARDFTFVLDEPVKGWRCSYFVKRDTLRSIVFGRFCKNPENAAAGVTLDALLASIRHDPDR